MCGFLHDSAGLVNKVTGHIFISLKVLSSRSIVCNSGVKRSLLSEGQLDADKAANLFPASRCSALASVAAAQCGIVFLHLHLSLLLGKAGCLQSWQHQVLLLQTVVEVGCLGLF